MTWPGMQMPHCRAERFTNACCTGCSARTRQAFDGAHVRAFAERGELQARGDGLAVHDDGADPARADAAADLGAGQLEVFAQNVEQQPVAGFEVDLDRVAVDSET